jgi:hypothetical protein
MAIAIAIAMIKVFGESGNENLEIIYNLIAFLSHAG